MVKKSLLALVLAAVIAGEGAFAQTGNNTITVDIGPTIIGLLAKGAIDAMTEGEMSSSGFGIAVQYERQILEKLSVGGRFAYLGFGFEMTERDSSDVSVKLGMGLSSFSIEGHVRYYPFGGVFFLDGMLGYANLSAKLSGEILVDGTRESASQTIPSNFFKLGAKLGWRINLSGSQSGFTFEPSIGYYGGIRLGKNIFEKLAEEAGGSVAADDEIIKYMENFLFVGGPRVSLAFGWRF